MDLVREPLVLGGVFLLLLIFLTVIFTARVVRGRKEINRLNDNAEALRGSLSLAEAELNLLNEAVRDLSCVVTKKDLLVLILKKFIKQTPSRKGCLLVKEGDNFICKLASGIDKKALREARFKSGEGLVGEVLRNLAPTIIKDIRVHERIKTSPKDSLLAGETKTVLSLPLLVGGKVEGIVNLYGEEASHFETNLRLYSTLASQAQISIQNANFYLQMAEKQRMQRELEIARDIQRLLLPDGSPQLPGFDIVGSNISAEEVGGDYYDYIPVSAQELGLVIGDVSGKGVPAGLVMTMVRTILRSEAPGERSPKEVLARVNRLLYPDLKPGTFITLFYAILNTENRSLAWARAGHDPAILYHQAKGEHELLRDEGMALGMDSGEMFSQIIEESTVQLNSGDALILYTDGVTEAMNPKEEEFGLERLVETVVENGEVAAEPLMKRITEKVTKFAGSAKQHDDITLIVLRAK